MTLLQGDARTLEGLLPGSVNCIVTSPPYWGSRRYTDQDEEIGVGDLSTYFVDMRQCARSWLNVLTDDGVCWLNLNDVSSGSGGAGGDYNKGGTAEGKPKYRQGKPDRPRMNLLNIPHRVVDVFVEEGWIYRRCIIWAKEWDNGTPQVRRANPAHERRPGDSHEYIFMLTKSTKYPYFFENEVEPGSVWHFSKELKNPKKHLAPFPAELPRRCILLSTQPGDVVLDPFVGSGTTVDVANGLGRIGVGVDI